jgi:pimeloyl-ACP methyl ester carboxylesterase
VLARAGTPLDLVGHSYGAAVALVAALQQPSRVRRLVLYEPTLFALVDADTPRPNDADGIRDAVARAGAALDAGDGDAAAAHFIDYWMGSGAWAATPASRRAPIVAAVAHVRGWSQALFGEPTPLEACAALRLPVLLLQGSDTTASARAVVQRLARTLPQVQLQVLDGLGHMGPVTHPERVNAAIQAFLAA